MTIDEDLPPLIEAFAELGGAAVPEVWDDPTVDWAAFDIVVVRSTWDYPERPGEFLRWADRVASVTRLTNPAAVLRWNIDKHYLRELEAASVPVVATTWVEPGSAVVLPASEDLVVKPVVSAGARDTARYRPGDPGGRVHAERLLTEGRSVMVQRYLTGLEAAGETALVFIGGAYSHTVRRQALLARQGGLVRGLFAEEHIETREPSPAELEVACSALALVPERDRLTYARVDLVPGPGGDPLVLEVELTEPSLYFAHAAGSAARLAAAVLGSGVATASGSSGRSPSG